MASNLEAETYKNIPHWLLSTCSKVLIKMILNSEHIANIELGDMKFIPIVPGNKFCANVTFIALVDYKKENVRRLQSVVVKILSDSNPLKTEMDIYTQVLPRFEAILREVGDCTTLSARCLFHFLIPKRFIILNDLVPQGYSLCDGYINLDCAKLLCKKLAKWQAVSYKLAIENPSFFEQYRHPYSITSNIMAFCTTMTKCIENFINILDRTPNLREYKHYFVDMLPNLALKCINSHKEYFENRQEDTIYVLANGDINLETTTYKYNEQSETLEDVMLINFQAANMAPIAHDLLDLLYLLMGPLMRRRSRDKILDFYFTQFFDTLMKIGFRGRLPKLTEFRAQFMQQKHYEIFLLTVTTQSFKSKANLAELQKVLSLFVQLGYFDD